MSIRKGDKIVYRAGRGGLYTAFVQRCHKDGTWTVRVHFPLEPDGSEAPGFQGDLFRIDRSNIAADDWRSYQAGRRA